MAMYVRGLEEINVGKGENAGNQHCVLFSLCFQMSQGHNLVKMFWNCKYLDLCYQMLPVPKTTLYQTVMSHSAYLQRWEPSHPWAVTGGVIYIRLIHNQKYSALHIISR